MKKSVYIEIDLEELEDYLNKEVMILYNEEKYFGLLQYVGENELTLSCPDSKVCLGFQLIHITNYFLKLD